MGRTKKDRAYSFKPKYKSFEASDFESNNEISLNHDELEAIFLMDYQDMYQEDAAKLMNVSRPTLSRIIKSARNKISTAIISGAKLNINDDKKDFKIAISLAKEESFEKITPKENLLAILHVENNKLLDVEYINNPITDPSIKPSEIFPPLLKSKEVNFFVTDNIGAGLKSSLIAKGIFVKLTKKIKSLNDIVKLFSI